jgi:uncharacterized protein Yka (UPF0111/DUF47 family)
MIPDTPVDKKSVIELLSKTDPIIKHVWDHYTVQGKSTPLNVGDVNYFWKKVSEYCAEIDETKKKLMTNI